MRCSSAFPSLIAVLLTPSTSTAYKYRHYKQFDQEGDCPRNDVEDANGGWVSFSTSGTLAESLDACRARCAEFETCSYYTVGWRESTVRGEVNLDCFPKTACAPPIIERAPPLTAQAYKMDCNVVECDTDCTETCHEVDDKEVNERDREFCTATDAIRSDSCTKCDGVAVTSSSKLLMLSAAGMMWPCYL